MKINIKVPAYIPYLLTHYSIGILFFFLFRVLFFFTITNHSIIETSDRSLIKHAFLIGIQFDTVIMGYILALPTLLLIVASFIKRKEWLVLLYKWSTYFIFTLLFSAFFICSVDIPYFRYNSSRLSAIIFNWANNVGIVCSMIIEEPSYFIFIFVFIFMCIAYLYSATFILKKITTATTYSPNPIIKLLCSVVSVLLIFMAMRGRMDSPIMINHSFFCNNSFYNQLGLNPVFTLLKSLDQSRHLNFMDDQVALTNVKKYLNISDTSNFNSPIARVCSSDKIPLKPNVVLVIMESMSAEKMGHFGNSHHLTPFLDSLANVSYCFENIYSAGKHTYNGIFSTLYSYPAILSQHLMSNVELKKFSGFPGILKNEGYETIYFTTHSETFDNVGVFLPSNHFNQVVSQKNYDQTKIHSSFGVPDHVQFDYALTKLDALNEKKAPFFATLMTVSDHAPFLIPKGIPFKPNAKNIEAQIVEYSDWSLNRFFTNASKKEWFKNTIFIFIADHGGVVGKNNYDIPLSYHHSPLLLYSSDTSIIKPKSYNTMGCQIDVFPTVMGLLNINYVNNTLGINLLSEKRPYAYFSADDKIGCIDNNFVYIYSINGKESLHKYRTADPVNYIKEYPNESAEMKKYAFSMTQSAKWLIATNKTEMEMFPTPIIK